MTRGPLPLPSPLADAPPFNLLVLVFVAAVVAIVLCPRPAVPALASQLRSCARSASRKPLNAPVLACPFPDFAQRRAQQRGRRRLPEKLEHCDQLPGHSIRCPDGWRVP